MSSTEAIHNRQIIGGITSHVRLGIPAVMAQEGRSRPGKEPVVHKDSPHVTVPLAKQYAAPVTIRPDLTIGQSDLLPPDSFIQAFERRGFNEADIQIFVAQYRMDRARVIWENAVPESRDESRLVYDKLTGVFEGMWHEASADSETTELTETKLAVLSEEPKTNRTNRFRTRLWKVIRDPYSEFSGRLLERHPDVARAYQVYEDKAEEIIAELPLASRLAEEGRFYFSDSTQEYTVAKNPLFVGITQTLVTGIKALNPSDYAYYIPEAYDLLERRITRLRQSENELDHETLQTLNALRSMWPHITALQERGNIKSINGAKVYYTALDARFNRRMFGLKELPPGKL